MSEDKRVAWLREQITERKALAEEACHGDSGHWWRRNSQIYLDGPPVPDGALYEGDIPESGADGDWLWYPEIVVYDEGRPSDEQFAHIAANDPQQVIADCEMQLGLLHIIEATGDAPYLVSNVAVAYRHKPGYAEHWGSAGY